MAEVTTLNNLTNLGGLFKEVYADNVEDLLPDEVQLQRDIAFASEDERPGLEFHQPVVTRREHGISYFGTSTPGASGSNQDGFGLQPAISGRISDAKIAGSQIMARARVGIETAARSTSSKGAFRKVFDPVVENLINSVANRAEVELFYGRQPLALVSSVTATTITIAAADWAPGMWVGQEGAKIEAWIDDTSAARTASSDEVITGVNADTRVLTVADTTGITAADHLHFSATPASGSDLISQRNAAVSAAGAGYNSMLGLSPMLSGIAGGGTTLTSILGIDPTTSSLWKATEYDALSGPLTFQKVNRAMAKMVPKGAPRKITLYVNPNTWADLSNDEAAQRRYVNKTGGVATVGPDGIEYHTQTGTVMIKASPFVKESHAFGIDPKLFKRIGATDITFRLPGRGDEFFLHIPDFASVELRCYLNYGLFTRALGKGLYIKNIVNNS